MKVYFATDHAGFALKEEMVLFVRDELGFDVEDLGAYELDPADDYPDFISKAAVAVAEPGARAIVFGGSGQGEALAANRFPHVRAAVWYGGSLDVVALSREHNNANVLSIGARFVTTDAAKEAVRTWLVTEFSNDERHVRRLEKVENLHIQ